MTSDVPQTAVNDVLGGDPAERPGGSAPEEFDFAAHAARAKAQYESQLPLYEEFSDSVKKILSTCLADSEIAVHSITSRAKAPEGFAKKAAKASSEDPALPRYTDPLRQIKDLAGVRVITYFLTTIKDVEQVVEREFEITERVDKSQLLERERRLGYQSVHYLVQLRKNRCELPEYAKYAGLTAEIQVRTILQHAWAEIEHDIQYKAIYEIPTQTRRRFMALAGLLEIADREFQAIEKEDRRLRETNLASVAQNKLVGVELTADTLRAYLDKRLGEDKRMSSYSYSWTVGLLKDLGFDQLDTLDEFLSGFDSYEISRAVHGTSKGQLTRLEDVIMVAVGTEYANRHPWADTYGSGWFRDRVDQLLERARGNGIEVGGKSLPPRIEDDATG